MNTYYIRKGVEHRVEGLAKMADGLLPWGLVVLGLVVLYNLIPHLVTGK